MAVKYAEATTIEKNPLILLVIPAGVEPAFPT
jgi:hypothetical protein